MTKIAEILNFMENNQGIIEVQDLAKLQIERKYLSLMNSKGLIKKATRGIYVLSTIEFSELYFLQTHSRYSVYSLDTALFLNNYLDILPSVISITVPQGYNGFFLNQKQVKLLYIKKELLELGLLEKEISPNKKVRYYNIERTILDLIKKKGDLTLLTIIIKRYLKEVKFNLSILFNYSEQMGLKEKLEDILNNFILL